jgi:hypothetical protein
VTVFVVGGLAALAAAHFFRRPAPPAAKAEPYEPAPVPEQGVPSEAPAASPVFADYAAAPEAPPAPAPEPVPARPPFLLMTRMSERTARETLKLLACAPALTLDTSVQRLGSNAAIRAAAGPAGVDGPPALLARAPDYVGLPFRSGPASRMKAEEARLFAELADGLKNLGNDAVSAHLSADAWRDPARIPVLMQVLTGGHEGGRKPLAKHLGRIKGKAASDALAKIALYDPSPDVRREAAVALHVRPAAEYRDALVAGLSSPAPVIAEHAAEALVALRRVDAVPALRAVLARPDPGAAYPKGAGKFVRELVRVGHRQNCLMCHPASFDAADRLRAEVPPLTEGPTGFGYGAPPPPRRKAFVRADVTYLRQDYSVVIHGERFDLFVRERAATREESAWAEEGRGTASGQHRAAAFALRHLIGETGPRREDVALAPGSLDVPDGARPRRR